MLNQASDDPHQEPTSPSAAAVASNQFAEAVSLKLRLTHSPEKHSFPDLPLFLFFVFLYHFIAFITSLNSLVHLTRLEH